MDGGRFISVKKASKMLGIGPVTIRKYCDEGHLESFRTPSGHRRIDVQQLQQFVAQGTAEAATRERICYARVSSKVQEDDLQRQVQWFRENFPGYRIVQDIGSGLNFKRRGLKAILERTMRGLVEEIVVTYRDRLCRFAWDLLEWICSTHGTRLIVARGDDNASPEQELVEDLVSIVTVFGCRLHGKRSRKRKRGHQDVEDSGTSNSQAAEDPGTDVPRSEGDAELGN
jgi:excisionase family DNA binding protein